MLVKTSSRSVDLRDLLTSFSSSSAYRSKVINMGIYRNFYNARARNEVEDVVFSKMTRLSCS